MAFTERNFPISSRLSVLTRLEGAFLLTKQAWERHSPSFPSSHMAYSKKSLPAPAAAATHIAKKQRKNSKCSVPAPTLVVCPPWGVATWKQQINKWTTRPGVLKHCSYSANKDVNWLMQHDLVFATFNQVSRPGSLLHQVEWFRVIVDDVHVHLQGLTSPVKPPFADLKAKRRWAVSGRVEFEKFQNLCPILCFFGLPLHYFDACLKLQSKVFMEILYLRRMLPVKFIENYTVILSNTECDIYDTMEAEAREAASSDSKLELSQEPELLTKVVTALQEDNDYACPVCMDQPEDFIITRCAHMFCISCITRIFKRCRGKLSCPICRALLTKKDMFATHQTGSCLVKSSCGGNMSSKVAALLNLVVKARNEDPGKKSVVLSQFQRMLMPLARALSEAGFDVKHIDGIDDGKKKARTIEEFRNANPPVILLASFKALINTPDVCGAESSCNVYMMEPCWDVINEREILGRVHGFWKKGNVKIVRLLCKDSIEERVLDIRE